MKEIKNFIEERQRLQDEGFQLVAFQEFTYFDELQDQYCEKVLKFEERLEDVITNTPDKMNNFLKHSYAKKKTIGDSKSWKVFHTATSHGFSGGAIAHLEEVDSAEGNLAMKQTFMAAFERIVGDTKEIPDKSCILLSASKHRMALCKERAVPNKVAKREAVAKVSSFFRRILHFTDFQYFILAERSNSSGKLFSSHQVAVSRIAIQKTCEDTKVPNREACPRPSR